MTTRRVLIARRHVLAISDTLHQDSLCGSVLRHPFCLPSHDEPPKGHERSDRTCISVRADTSVVSQWRTIGCRTVSRGYFS